MWIEAATFFGRRGSEFWALLAHGLRSGAVKLSCRVCSVLLLLDLLSHNHKLNDEHRVQSDFASASSASHIIP